MITGNDLQFRSSYTVVEHAPEESIELEIERHALEQIEKLQAAARDGDFTELFRLLGTSEAQRAIEGDGDPGPEYTSVENTVVEAVHAKRHRLHVLMRSYLPCPGIR